MTDNTVREGRPMKQRMWTLDDINWVRSRYLEAGVDILGHNEEAVRAVLARKAALDLTVELDLEVRGLAVDAVDIRLHKKRTDVSSKTWLATYRTHWWPSVKIIRIEGAGTQHGTILEVREVGESIRVATMPRAARLFTTDDHYPTAEITPNYFTIDLTGWDPSERVWIYEPR